MTRPIHPQFESSVSPSSPEDSVSGVADETHVAPLTTPSLMEAVLGLRARLDELEHRMYAVEDKTRGDASE